MLGRGCCEEKKWVLDGQDYIEGSEINETCDYCVKKFNQKSDLKIHISADHEDQVASVSIVGRVYRPRNRIFIWEGKT